MNIDRIYRFSNFFFLFLFAIILIDSFDQHFGYWLNIKYPKIYFFTFGSPEEGWRSIIWNENGFVETLQVTFLLITIIILIVLLKKTSFKKTEKIIKIFVLIEIIGLCYFLFEEISWGQNFINFKTPNLLFRNDSILSNNQEEFNLHNISNLFNELPRSLVLLWCGFSIFIINILRLKNENILVKLVVPKKQLLVISIVILAIFIPDFIVSKLNLIDYQKLHIIDDGKFVGYDLQMFLTVFLSFNFFRISELQEFLFSYYFFWHTLFLREKLIFK